jgi:hypothetical protein
MVEFSQVKYILGSDHDDPELKELSNDVQQYFTEYLEADPQKREYFEDLLDDKIDSYNTVMQLQKDDYK